MTGGEDPPDASTKGDASLFVTAPGDRRTRVANLDYERSHNPDGQPQFSPNNGEPLDSLSNPFAVSAVGPRGVLVADGGGNDVLSVSRPGKVRTFFVPPLVNTGGCKGAPNNAPGHPKGCDPVLNRVA